MADRQRNVEVKVHLTKEGQLEVFRQLADDANDFEKAGDQAEKSLDRLNGQLERSGNASDKSFAKAKLAIEDYRKEIEEAEKAGKQIGDADRQKLETLEKSYAGATQRVGEFRKEQQQVKRALDDATEAAGGQAARINSLDDLINKMAEDMGAGAVKWLSWGTAAAGAFAVGYEAGTKLKQVLDEVSNGEFSRNMQESFRGVTESMAGFNDEIDAAFDKQRALNESHVLLKKGFDLTGLSVEEVHKKFVAYTGGLQAAEIATEKFDAEYSKFIENTIGKTGKELDKQAENLAKFIARFADENKQLTQADIAKLFGKQVDDLLVQYEKLHKEVPPKLKDIEDGWRLAGVAATDSAGKQVDAAGKVTVALNRTQQEILSNIKHYQDMGAAVPASLAKMADSVGILRSAWEKAAEPVKDLAKQIKEMSAGAALELAKIPGALQMMDTKQLDALIEKLKTLQEGAAAAATAIDQVVASATGTDTFGNKTEFGYGVPDSHNISPNW